MNTARKQSKQKPRRTLSLRTGNIIQGLGTGLGAILVWLSVGQPAAPRSTVLMIAGYLLIYFMAHSISHYAAGRLAGIRFVRYSVGGSALAAGYPPGMRQIFERLPFFAVHTEPGSLRTASPSARAAMFAAGTAASILFTTVAALLAYLAQVPGALQLLVFNLFWHVGTVAAETRAGGDLGKARAALRSRSA